jgi:RNA polymerase sigma-70 factor (ECF subfamily)
MMTVEFNELIEEHYDRLRWFVRKRVSNPEEADDLVQEICLRAVSKIDTIRDDARVESWLYQIARNAVIDHYRRTRPVGPLPDDLVASNGFAHFEEPELPACLPGLLAELTEPDREALRLTAIDGMKQRELAERLGISLSGAKSRVQRARGRLREMIADCCHLELDRLGGVIDIRPNRECRLAREVACEPCCAAC